MSDIKTIADFIYNDKQFLLNTTKFDEHLPYHYYQTSGYAEWLNWPQTNLEQQQFIKDLVKNRFVNEFIEGIPIDNTVNKVIDVGSGFGINDLLMSQLRPNTDFYLLDKNVDSQTLENLTKTITAYFSKSLDDQDYHGFYNSFDITKDIIQNSPINPERIHFLDTGDSWPEQVDVIISLCSWMWHYHKDIYWNKLLTSLKVGGHFAVTVTLRSGDRTIEEISEDLGSYPSQIMIVPEGTDSNTLLTGYNDVVSMGYYIWQRMR